MTGGNWFDAYERKARLLPGLLAVAPVALVVVAMGLRRNPAIATGGALLTAIGGTYVVATLVRHLGSSVEPRLWAGWNGPPTTRFLRLREGSDNPVERQAWRTSLQQVTAVTLLDAEEEQRDAALADQTIATAVNQVRHLGQGSGQYPLVHTENIQYGFERNLYAVRWVGRLVSLLSALALIVTLSALRHHASFSTSSAISGLSLNVAFLIGWSLVPSDKRVRFAADRYARQLFQAVVAESRTRPNGRTS